jgi:hypothetical protein
MTEELYRKFLYSGKSQFTQLQEQRQDVQLVLLKYIEEGLVGLPKHHPRTHTHI